VPAAQIAEQITRESLAARLPKLRLAADPGLVYEPSANMRKAQHLNVEWT